MAESTEDQKPTTPPVDDKTEETSPPPLTQADLEEASRKAIADYKKQQAEKVKQEKAKKEAEETNDYKALYEQQQAEAAELKKKVFQASAQAALQRAQAIYPDVLASAIPEDTADLDRAVLELKKKYPEAFRVDNINGGSGTGNASNSKPFENDMNLAIRRAAGRQ